MASTKIEWTEKVWNPVRGCAIVSKGCTNCYAMRQAHRFSGAGGAYEGLTKLSKGGPVWTGAIRTVPELLEQPLRWNKPRRIFVNSMSDLFHEDVPDDFILRVFDVMRQSENGHAVKLNRLMHPHTFQILTKRAARMLDFCQRIRFAQNDDRGLYLADTKDHQGFNPMLALKHVWLGVSVEDQAAADERIPLLLQTPAAVRWISVEPCLGHIDLSKWLHASRRTSVSRPNSDGVVLGRSRGPDLASHSRSGQQGRSDGGHDAASAGASGAEPFSDGRVSPGVFSGRSHEAASSSSSGSLDDRQQATDSRRHGDQSRERHQVGQSPGEPIVGRASRERNPCDTQSRQDSSAHQGIGHEDHRSGRRADQGATCSQGDEPEAARQALRIALALDPQHRHPQDLEAHSVGLSWCVAGGESGPGARPMHPDWARSLRDQCDAAGVPFFFKQWGAWAPWEEYPPGPPEGLKTEACWPNGTLGYGSWGQSGGAGKHVVLVGKKIAGRMLDGRTHDEYPK